MHQYPPTNIIYLSPVRFIYVSLFTFSLSLFFLFLSFLFLSPFFVYSQVGWYMYAEANDGIKGEQARMISEDIRINVNAYKCFRFWYFIYGSSIGAFRIFTSPTGAFDDLGSPLFEITATQGNQWKMGQVYLEIIKGPTKLHSCQLDN